MRCTNWTRWTLYAALVGAIAAPWALSRAEVAAAADVVTANSFERAAPKPLSDSAKRGLDYLIDGQHEDGGWGQGGGWRSSSGGRVDGSNVSDPTDLGNTCIATLALLRSGSTPTKGPYAQNISRAAKLICKYVEKSNDDSLYVTDVRDTQLQSKIGQYVDTFLAGLVLTELKGKMPAEDSENRLMAALNKTVAKIERNQREDGSFAGNTGWASVLSQGLASKFLNRAAQNNVAVRNEVLERDYRASVAQLDKKTGEFRAAAPAIGIEGGLGGAAAVSSDAGVKLYLFGSNASRISEQSITSAQSAQRAKATLESKSASAKDKERARHELARVDEVRESEAAAVGGIVKQLGDKDFVAGFGNNGGEEFLSYMNISEMLVVRGGNEWESWQSRIGDNLARVQNRDGSWSGQHCITGRTFCTSAALLTLLADRAPVPLAAQIRAGK